MFPPHLPGIVALGHVAGALEAFDEGFAVRGGVGEVVFLDHVFGVGAGGLRQRGVHAKGLETPILAEPVVQPKGPPLVGVQADAAPAAGLDPATGELRRAGRLDGPLDGNRALGGSRTPGDVRPFVGAACPGKAGPLVFPSATRDQRDHQAGDQQLEGVRHLAPLTPERTPSRRSAPGGNRRGPSVRDRRSSATSSAFASLVVSRDAAATRKTQPEHRPGLDGVGAYRSRGRPSCPEGAMEIGYDARHQPKGLIGASALSMSLA